MAVGVRRSAARARSATAAPGAVRSRVADELVEERADQATDDRADDVDGEQLVDGVVVAPIAWPSRLGADLAGRVQRRTGDRADQDDDPVDDEPDDDPGEPGRGPPVDGRAEDREDEDRGADDLGREADREPGVGVDRDGAEAERRPGRCRSG